MALRTLERYSEPRFGDGPDRATESSQSVIMSAWWGTLHVVVMAAVVLVFAGLEGHLYSWVLWPLRATCVLGAWGAWMHTRKNREGRY